MQQVSIGPKPMVRAVLIGAIVLGFALYALGPDPLASAEAGGRPSTVLATIKWGGMILAVIALVRMFNLKRVSAGPEGLEVATLLKRTRHDWSALTGANLEGRPIEYALRFGPRSTTLRRSDYAESDIAALRDVVKAHHG